MKVSLTLFLLLCGIFGFSQNNHLPPNNITQSFQREYPKSHPSDWKQSNDGGWSVSFDDNDHNNGEVMAYYNKSGKHYDTHIPYDKKDVPSTVSDHMQKHYGSTGDYEYTRIDRPGENSVYLTHYKHKKSYKAVYVNKEGHEKEYHDKYHNNQYQNY